MRTVAHRYVDPLAQIWLECAAKVGLRVVRNPDAYASYQTGTLTIGSDDTLDADDSLAQMIFHELCHSLVQGPDSFAERDWGLDNETDRDAWREHACLRTQAVLAARHGLRRFFAPTTDYRSDFWDHLPEDPLAPRSDRSVQAAILAIRRAATPPWSPHLEHALARTAQVAAAARTADPTSLWSLVDVAPAPHPTGLPAGAGSCGTCAWRGPRDRCRQAGAKVAPEWPGCERYEPALDCQDCGACCRAAYHAVEVSARDPMVKARPEYIVQIGKRREVRRAGDRCAALEGTVRYTCVIYEDRPRTCRDFTNASDNCLIARRRVGLSL